MCRDEGLARETQVDALRGDLAALRDHLADAHRAREAAVAALAIAAGRVPLLSAIIEDPLLTPQGVAFHILYGHGLIGLAAAGFVIVLASPRLLLPWLSARRAYFAR